MFSSNFTILVDVILLMLLIISNIYLYKLINRFKHFRQAQDEMKQISKELGLGIERAEAAVNTLKATADKKGKELQKTIDSSDQILHELEYIYQAADNVAQRLEGLKGPTAGKPSLSTAKSDKSSLSDENLESEEEAKLTTKAERELAEALKRRKQQS